MNFSAINQTSRLSITMRGESGSMPELIVSGHEQGLLESYSFSAEAVSQLLGAFWQLSFLPGITEPICLGDALISLSSTSGTSAWEEREVQLHLNDGQSGRTRTYSVSCRNAGHLVADLNLALATIMAEDRARNQPVS